MSKTVKITMEQEAWLQRHGDVNFSGLVRDAIDRAMAPKVAGRDLHAVIVAAGPERGMAAGDARPRAMLDIKGKTILERQADVLREAGVRRIAVVRGYKKELIAVPNLVYYDNPDYEKTFVLDSLMAARDEIKGEFLFLYSDILFDEQLIQSILDTPGDVVLGVDRSWKARYDLAKKHPEGKVELVQADSASPPRCSAVGRKLKMASAFGEFTGVALFRPSGARALIDAYDHAVTAYAAKPFHEAKNISKSSFLDMVHYLIHRRVNVRVCPLVGGWMEIDTFDDYRRSWMEVVA